MKTNFLQILFYNQDLAGKICSCRSWECRFLSFSIACNYKVFLEFAEFHCRLFLYKISFLFSSQHHKYGQVYYIGWRRTTHPNLEWDFLYFSNFLPTWKRWRCVLFFTESSTRSISFDPIHDRSYLAINTRYQLSWKT